MIAICIMDTMDITLPEPTSSTGGFANNQRGCRFFLTPWQFVLGMSSVSTTLFLPFVMSVAEHIYVSRAEVEKVSVSQRQQWLSMESMWNEMTSDIWRSFRSKGLVPQPQAETPVVMVYPSNRSNRYCTYSGVEQSKLECYWYSITETLRGEDHG